MKIELKQQDLEGVAILFDKVRDVYNIFDDIDQDLA